MPDEITIEPAYRDLMTSLGLTSAEAVFSHARLRVWRDLPDRDNSTLDADGVRLHVKRDKVRRKEPMSLEADGIALLREGGIGTAPLVAHGALDDGRTFVITANLDGFMSADRLLEAGGDHATIVAALIDVAARLHRAGLHHRDLYANHFYLRPTDGGFDVRLIDTARVRRRPWIAGGRWIVKDVAQLVFSLAGYVDADGVLRHYERAFGETTVGFAWRVRRKAASIARHDAALRAKSPTRNLRLSDGN